MNNSLVFFNINEETKQYLLLINLCPEQNHLYRFDVSNIIFVDDENREIYQVYNDAIIYGVESLYHLLKKALNNELNLHDFTETSIGLSRNQYFQKKNEAMEINKKDKCEWAGGSLLLWEVPSKLETWLYNKNNKIFIEITPVYPWHFSDPREHEHFIPYNEWIKNYKPLMVAEIEKEFASDWLIKTEKIIQEIEKSDAKYLHSQK